MGISQDDNLKLYLPMNEGSGTTCNDYSGEGNNGTITGASWTSKKDRDNVLSFDGTDDYVNCGTNILTTAATSFSLWIKKSSDTMKPFAGLKIGGAGGSIFYWGSTDGGTGSAMMGFRGEHEIYTPTNSLTSGVWQHLMFIYDGNNDDSVTSYKIYINNINQILTRRGGLITGSTTTNFIGSENAGSFDGIISDVQIFDKALTQEQITHIYKTTYRE